MRGCLLALCALLVGVVLVPARADGAASATVRVNFGGLNVRSGPSTSYPVVRVLTDGAPLSVSCQAIGPSIAGLIRTTTAWDRLADGTYVTDAYVARPASPGACAASGPTANVPFGLNLRANASTQLAPLGTVGPGEALNITCQLRGEAVGGTSLWDWVPVAGGALVSDAFVAWPGGRPALPWCSVGSGSAPASRDAFIRWAADLGRQVRAATGVPVSVTIAQAILESGWGSSALSEDGNSFFGMKCSDTPGAATLGCRPYATTECAASCYPTTASFRVYATAAASFVDHAQQLATLPRYRSAFAYAGDPNRFATELRRAGYATDPRYAQSLIDLMRQYNLYQYDRP